MNIEITRARESARPKPRTRSLKFKLRRTSYVPEYREKKNVHTYRPGERSSHRRQRWPVEHRHQMCTR